MRGFIDELEDHPVTRVPGSAIFLVGPSPRMPPILPHHIAHNQVLHEQVLLVTVVTEEVPRVSAQDRLKVESLGAGFHRLYVHYGFMQSPDIPVALRLADELGLSIDLDSLTYYVGRETIIPSDEVPGMSLWREKLFAFLSRNAMDATTFYKLPADRVVELGIQVPI